MDKFLCFHLFPFDSVKTVHDRKGNSGNIFQFSFSFHYPSKILDFFTTTSFKITILSQTLLRIPLRSNQPTVEIALIVVLWQIALILQRRVPFKNSTRGPFGLSASLLPCLIIIWKWFPLRTCRTYCDGRADGRADGRIFSCPWKNFSATSGIRTRADQNDLF